MMKRRFFLQALAASVVAAGAPLPVGFPEDWPEDAMDLSEASLERLLLEYDLGAIFVGVSFDGNPLA